MIIYYNSKSGYLPIIGTYIRIVSCTRNGYDHKFNSHGNWIYIIPNREWYFCMIRFRRNGYGGRWHLPIVELQLSKINISRKWIGLILYFSEWKHSYIKYIIGNIIEMYNETKLSNWLKVFCKSYLFILIDLHFLKYKIFVNSAFFCIHKWYVTY